MARKVVMDQAKNLMDLYTEFVRLRQSGQSGEEAWNQLADDVKRLSQRELMRLIGLLRAWEASGGRSYKPIRGAAASPPRAEPEPPKESVIRRIAPPRPADSAPARPAGSTQIIVPSHESVYVADKSTSTFTDDMVLYLYAEGNDEPLRVKVPRGPMIIGRYAPDSSVVPDVDLAVFGAAGHGVSRLHAELSRAGNTLVISDMNSVNHTYLNGVQLHPKEVRVLRDGDELRFGGLTVRVRFGTS